jgi:ribosome maturation factor RimP
MSQNEQPVSPAGVDLERVRELVEPVVVAHGVRLVDVEWTSAHGGQVLRLTIESTQPHALPGSVTLEDCVRVSRDASTVLDVEDPIEQSYHLEVSSPGLDRRLQSVDDFRRTVGSVAKVKLTRPATDGQRVLRGVVLAVSDGQIRMDVDGNEHVVSLDHIAEARPVVDLGAKPPKKRGGRTKRSRRGKSAGRANKTSTGQHRPGSRKES